MVNIKVDKNAFVHQDNGKEVTLTIDETSCKTIGDLLERCAQQLGAEAKTLCLRGGGRVFKENNLLKNLSYSDLHGLTLSTHVILKAEQDKSRQHNELNKAYFRDFVSSTVSNKEDLYAKINPRTMPKYSPDTFFQVCEFDQALQKLALDCRDSAVFLLNKRGLTYEVRQATAKKKLAEIDESYIKKYCELGAQFFKKILVTQMGINQFSSPIFASLGIEEQMRLFVHYNSQSVPFKEVPKSFETLTEEKRQALFQSAWQKDLINDSNPDTSLSL